jgi:hypothetical protein
LEKEQLRVFDRLPTDERVTTIHESFVPAVSHDVLPTTKQELAAASERWMRSLRERCFRGWPLEADDLHVKVVAETQQDGISLRAIDYTSQQPYRLRMYVLGPERADVIDVIEVRVLAQNQWETIAPGLAAAMPQDFANVQPSDKVWQGLVEQSQGDAIALVVPRGVGPTEWSRDHRNRTHIRRRFMQLGQTAATMQIYDVRRALQALDQIDDMAQCDRYLSARGEASVWTAYATLFEDPVNQLELVDLPVRNRHAPDLLNVSRFVEMPHVAMMAAERAGQLTLVNDEEASGEWKNILDGNRFAAERIQLVVESD